MTWPPRIAINIDADSFIQNIHEAAEQSRKGIEGFISNTKEDIQLILGV